MSDETNDKITVGNITNSQNIAIGRNAKVIVYPEYRPEAVYNLPPPNPHFVGRIAQLEAIATNFASPANPQVVMQAIAGLGGVGKTQLALAYAHTCRDQYDMLWLLRASDTPTLDNELRLLGVTLKIVTEEETEAEAIRAKVLSHLSSSKKRWLLLYDNVDELTPRELRPYLPGGGHVLITSRRAAAHWKKFGQTLALDTFSAVEATAFWQERKLPDAPELEELADELGFLPLAMEQAAAFMQMQQLPATEYLSWFREARDSLWAEEDAPTDYPKTVATTWQIGFDHAKKRKGAAELLNLCCFLDPDGIPLDLIKRVTDVETLQTMPLREVVADERQLRLALTALRDYSLLQVEDGTLTLHRLVQTVARDRMGSKRARAWVEVAVDLLANVYFYDHYDIDTWETNAKLIPHLTTITDFAVKFNCETPNSAYLNNVTGYYIEIRGNYAAALPFYKNALNLREKLFGQNHPDTATSLNNLGLLLQNMGNLAIAQSYFERAIIIYEKTLGTNHHDTAISLNNLGLLMQTMGELTTAQQHFERARTICEKTLEYDDPIIISILNNLGTLLHETGELSAARSHFERVIKICEKTLGPSHPNTATSLNNLGLLLQDLSEFKAAHPLFERALSIREKVLGTNHPDTATSLNNLGLLLQAMGELSAAYQFYKRAFEIRKRVLGSNHLDTANSLNNLGFLLQAKGNLTDAQPYFERSLAVYEKTIGPDNPRTATPLLNLGVLLQDIGDLSTAQSYFERAVAIYKKHYGLNHPDTAHSISNLAILTYHKREYTKSARLMRQALAIREKRLGPDHPDTVGSRESLVVIEAKIAS
ncbi:tetratricopeptide repeat protein [Candidatus Leptofilum sp.]|uniref:tetratricopeptide repeat protein n=1 Tax=Candidatus Leptofilum sp. TaxID=3241576 RepID=UPI003B5C6039